MEETSKTNSGKLTSPVLLHTFFALMVMAVVAGVICYQVMKAEAHARYVGIRNVSAEKVARIIRGTEMNANNIFDDVDASLDNPEDVVAALKAKVNLNLDVRGYFAAFEPNYFPEKGTWFEPYFYQPETGGFEYRQVGSARHNYTKSPWYIRAKETGASFWSDPYYYYDGTSMSGHYCTFIKPLFDNKGDLACVCGADMKFEWLAKELQWVDETSRRNNLLNKYHLLADFDFYTIILSNDGTCIAHPEGKEVNFTNETALNDIVRKHSGVMDMNANGTPCTVYYGPIEFVDWTIAVVVPKQDMLKPMLPVGGILLLVAFIGLFIVWRICKRQ